MAQLEIETCRGVDEGSSSTSALAATTTNSTLEVSTEPKPRKRRIEKVPLTMRRDEKTKGYFDPKVVSIGPYHHGKEELQMAERIKPLVAELFISGSGKDMDEFRKNVLGIVDDARSCYIEGSSDEEDVKELRARDIIFTPCTSDEEAVQMFNSIPTFLMEDFNIYHEVKQKIQGHYNNKAKTRFAELIHNYFKSPWTFIAFVATATLIILSFLQTYFTISPRKSRN